MLQLHKQSKLKKLKAEQGSKARRENNHLFIR